MKLQGKLYLNNDCEYLIEGDYEDINVSNLLDKQLETAVEISVKQGKKALFQATGELFRLRNEDKNEDGSLKELEVYIDDREHSFLYRYEIDGENLDDVLWENVGNVVTLHMIGVEKDDTNKTSARKVS